MNRGFIYCMEMQGSRRKQAELVLVEKAVRHLSGDAKQTNGFTALDLRQG